MHNLSLENKKTLLGSFLVIIVCFTKKAIEEKRITKTIEAYFFYQVGILKDKNGKKFTGLELVSMFKNNAGVERHTLFLELNLMWFCFYQYQ
jgi:hypothetical protein